MTKYVAMKLQPWSTVVSLTTPIKVKFDPAFGSHFLSVYDSLEELYKAWPDAGYITIDTEAKGEAP